MEHAQQLVVMERNLDTELVSLRHSMDMATALILVQEEQVLARRDVMQDVVQVCSESAETEEYNNNNIINNNKNNYNNSIIMIIIINN